MSATLHAPSMASSGARYDRGSSDAFGEYLSRIGKETLLTASEEVELAQRIEVGLFATKKLEEGVADPTYQRELAWLAHEGKRAKKRFIEANLRLVVSIAKNYSGRGALIMDLVQDGNLGLIHAVEKFDFTVGFKFSTYATWWIRQSIHRGMADKARMIRIPVHTVEKLNKIKRTRQELTSLFEREPTVGELAEASDILPHDVVRLLKYDQEPISLAMPVGDGAGDISELIMDGDSAQPDECAMIALRTIDVSSHLNALPEREQSILRARFGLTGDAPFTLEQIAVLEGVTRERVRQIEKRALAALRVPCLQLYLTD